MLNKMIKEGLTRDLTYQERLGNKLNYLLIEKALLAEATVN